MVRSRKITNYESDEAYDPPNQAKKDTDKDSEDEEKEKEKEEQ